MSKDETKINEMVVELIAKTRSVELNWEYHLQTYNLQTSHWGTSYSTVVDGRVIEVCKKKKINHITRYFGRIDGVEFESPLLKALFLWVSYSGESPLFKPIFHEAFDSTRNSKLIGVDEVLAALREKGSTQVEPVNTNS